MPNILKKKHFYLLLYISSITLFIIMLLSVSLPKKFIIFNQSRNNVPVGEIYGETKIGQTFVAEHNNLSAIHVLFGTYNRENQGVFYFNLKSDIKSKEDIFKHHFLMSTLQDNEFSPFVFPKIENSKGKKYYFYLDAPQSQPGNAITIWSHSEDLYKEGEKIVNGVASDGDLTFKTEYESGMRLSSNTFLGNLIKPGKFLVNIIKNISFYLLLIILASTWAFIAFFKKFEFSNKKGGFLLIFCILFMVLFIWILASFSKKVTVFNQPQNNIPAGEIYGDRKIGQTFVADYNNLSAIELLLATYKRKNTGEFVFHLREDAGRKKDLFQYRGDIGEVKDNKYFRFRFPEIKNAKGKKFYFYLEAPQSRPGKAITVWSYSEDIYEEGEQTINGTASDGDLVFRTTYNPGLKNKLSIFLEEITQNKPFPLNEKSFYISLILLLLLSISLFMTYLAKFFIQRQ